MSWLRLLRSELRKLTTTKMPWAFVSVLLGISTITAIAVIYGTDADGSKAFIATRSDQRSLLAFAANAVIGSSLFGAIAVAREYGHGTVVPMFLGAPRRQRAVWLLQLPVSSMKAADEWIAPSTDSARAWSMASLKRAGRGTRRPSAPP